MTDELVQLDPPDCGCTECMIGLYKPLNRATYAEVRLMLDGGLSNATSEKFLLGPGGIISAVYSSQTWEPTCAACGSTQRYINDDRVASCRSCWASDEDEV